MPAPNLTPDMLALVDQEHSAVRNVLDLCPKLQEHLNETPAAAAMFGRLIAIDCLTLAADPLKLLTRLAAWDRLCQEYGG